MYDSTPTWYLSTRLAWQNANAVVQVVKHKPDAVQAFFIGQLKIEAVGRPADGAKDEADVNGFFNTPTLFLNRHGPVQRLRPLPLQRWGLA